MPQSERRIELKKFKPAIRRIEQLHHYKMLNYLFITGSTLLYIFLIISFLQKTEFDFRSVTQENFPKIFHISSIILTGSFIFNSRIIDLYLTDRIVDLRKNLSFIIISGLSVIITQSMAWIELLNMEMYGSTQNYQSYLYLFSGIHMIHICGATVFIAFLFYKITTVEGDQVKSIVFLTNPYEKVKLEIATTIWRYIVLSWLVIYVFFIGVY